MKTIRFLPALLILLVACDEGTTTYDDPGYASMPDGGMPDSGFGSNVAPLRPQERCFGPGVKTISFTLDHWEGASTRQIANEMRNRTGATPTIFVDGPRSGQRVTDLRYGEMGDTVEIGMHGWGHGPSGDIAGFVRDNARDIRNITGLVPRVAALPANFTNYTSHFRQNGAVFVRTIRSNAEGYTRFATPRINQVSEIDRYAGPFVYFAHTLNGGRPGLTSGERQLLNGLYQAIASSGGGLRAMSYYGSNYCVGKPLGAVVPSQRPVSGDSTGGGGGGGGGGGVGMPVPAPGGICSVGQTPSRSTALLFGFVVIGMIARRRNHHVA